MRRDVWLGALLGYLLMAVSLHGQETKKSVDFLANALSWYAEWMTPNGSAAKSQICDGVLGSGSYRIICNPLGVVVDVSIDSSGGCYITVMRHHYQDEKTDYTPPSARSPGAGDVRCGGLPTEVGAFSVAVEIPERVTDVSLSRQAREIALAYSRHSVRSCVWRVPKVSRGDPFFHVYEECEGLIEAVWEFPIKRGRPLDFAHWTYTRNRDTIPIGAEKRAKNSDLWFDVIEPKAVR